MNSFPSVTPLAQVSILMSLVALSFVPHLERFRKPSFLAIRSKPRKWKQILCTAFARCSTNRFCSSLTFRPDWIKISHIYDKTAKTRAWPSCKTIITQFMRRTITITVVVVWFIRTPWVGVCMCGSLNQVKAGFPYSRIEGGSGGGWSCGQSTISRR